MTFGHGWDWLNEPWEETRVREEKRMVEIGLCERGKERGWVSAEEKKVKEEKRGKERGWARRERERVCVCVVWV